MLRSRIAIWTGGKVTVLRNEVGDDEGTPTAVSFGDERLVGTEAEKHLQVRPNLALLCATDVIGTRSQTLSPMSHMLSMGRCSGGRPQCRQVSDVVIFSGKVYERTDCMQVACATCV